MSQPPAWEELDQFFDADDFAVPAVISFRAGGTRNVNVIFDDPYVNAEAGGYERDDVRPKASGKLSDFSGVGRFDKITIDGTTYDVLTGPHPDGTGLGYLELARP